MTSNIQNNFVQAYLDLNKLLVKTLIVKSFYGAYAINEQLIKQYGESAVNKYDQTTWKYYVNVSGEYHPTDVPMNVISLDTQELILFHPEVLKFHTATAEAYRHGTRYYYSLVRSFPDQEFLINCILTPTPKEKAIAAPDGSILAYPKYLVEDHETTLIMELEKFINIFNSRWDVQAFALTDTFYAFMQRVIMGLQLVPKLLNLRTKRCKTDEVHSFHLTQYLASHHRLDRWLPYLTREQALWLYRNITYIERNAGTKETFQALLTNILDKRFIPLVEYTVRQLQEFDQDGYPLISAKRKQLSLAAPSVSETFVDMEVLYKKESALTYGSALYLESHKDRMNHQLKTSNSSVIQTKDLESSLIDLSTSVPDSLEEVLMRQLVAMTHDGLYNVMVNFQDTKTSLEYSISTWDALLYMTYLQYKSLKIPFDVVPCAYNLKYRIHPRPPVTDLTKFLDPQTAWLLPVAQELVANQPVLTECFSVSMFYNTAYQIYEECQRHWKLLAEVHDVRARGVLEQMILKLFAFQNRDFSRGEPVEVWRTRLNLPEYDYSYEEAQDLIRELFTRATGYRVDDTRQLRSIQKALIELFGTLSSYSIQVIREINDTPIIQAGGNGLRVGSIEEIVLNQTTVGLGIHTTDAQASFQDLSSESCNIKNEVTMLHQEHYDFIELRYETNVGLNAEDYEIASTSIKAIDFDILQENIDPVSGVVSLVPPLGLDKLLTQEQLKKLITSELFA